MEGLTGKLLGGYWDSAGVLHREFELKTLTGQDEEMLAQTGLAQSASVVNPLLSRAVKRVGKISPVTEEVAGQLLVADRQYLLLKLRQLTFGDIVHADLYCPWSGCGQRITLQFGISNLPLKEPPERAPFYSFTLSPRACDEEDANDREVSFRLPNGTDQEIVSPLLEENEAGALSLLLSRTVQRMGRHSPPSEARIASLSSLGRAEIEAEMERVAPRVELDIETTCAECGRSFLAPFDVHQFFFGEMRADCRFLYRQVHYLAFHYHWGESEIMGMPGNKRRKYIEQLADEIERLNHVE